jgi:hypothetical protein
MTNSRTEEIDSNLRGLKVAEPIKYKNLMIFPLTTRVEKRTDYVTLDKAMEYDWLRIREIDGGEVNSVELMNTGDKIVFILTGEMLTGAKQDRMLREDLLVPPKSGWLRIPVYCVEHGRWLSVSSSFKSAGEVAPNELRYRAKITEDQSEVWDAIASSQERLGINSGTSTVQANYQDERIKQELAEYTEHLEKIPRLNKTTVGVVAAVGERIICVDIFADNDLLVKFWRKLLRSYTMDAISERKAAVSKSAVDDLLHDLRNAKYVSIGTPGLGDLYRIDSNSGKGNALLLKGTVVHMDFFVGEANTGSSPELRLDFRRDQRLDD